MKPQPYNRKNRFFSGLTRTQVFLTIFGALFVLCWVFVLGIFVGRGYVSDTISKAFTDQIQKLQSEKNALMEKYLAQGKKADIPQEDVVNPPLDFYKNLSKKESETHVVTPQPTPKPVPEREIRKESETHLGSPPAAPKPIPESETRKETKEPLPEAKTPKERPEPVNGLGTMMVQIGSYREEATAQSSVKRLQEKGYSAQIKSKEIPLKGGKWFRVQIGPLKNKSEAEKMVKKLEQDGFRAVMLENNPL